MPIPFAESDEQTKPTCSQNGIAREQMRQMLKPSPEERLLRVQDFVESALAIRALNEKTPVR